MNPIVPRVAARTRIDRSLSAPERGSIMEVIVIKRVNVVNDELIPVFPGVWFGKFTFSYENYGKRKAVAARSSFNIAFQPYPLHSRLNHVFGIGIALKALDALSLFPYA